jgi:hypothetical protein
MVHVHGPDSVVLRGNCHVAIQDCVARWIEPCSII